MRLSFLGITFDERLSWDKHVENLYKRLKSAIAVIKRIKACIGKENFKRCISPCSNVIYYTVFQFGVAFPNLD